MRGLTPPGAHLGPLGCSRQRGRWRVVSARARLWVSGWKLEWSRDTQAPSAGLLREECPSPQRLQMGLASPQRRARMRAIIAVITALVGMALSGSQVDAGAWRATYRWVSVNCGYSSS